MSNLRKSARLAPKTHLFGQSLLSGQRLPFRFLKYYVATASLDDGNQDVNIHSRLLRSTNYGREDVTSSSRRTKITTFRWKNPNVRDSKRPTRQVPKIVEEAEKRTKTHHPNPMCKRQAENSPRRKRRQRIPVLCHLNPKNACEGSKKTYDSSRDFIDNSETLTKDPENP